MNGRNGFHTAAFVKRKRDEERACALRFALRVWYEAAGVARKKAFPVITPENFEQANAMQEAEIRDNLQAAGISRRAYVTHDPMR